MQLQDGTGGQSRGHKGPTLAYRKIQGLEHDAVSDQQGERGQGVQVVHLNPLGLYLTVLCHRVF